VRLKPLGCCLLLLISTLIFSSVSFAQDVNVDVDVPTSNQEMPKDAEPPPLKVISQDEREKLSRETNVRNRTRLSLDLMNVRLKNAEELHSKNQYQEMFKEMGKFHALVDNALWFLKQNNTRNSAVLNNFKRLEIGLRTFLPRLELIRRSLPMNYEYYVRTLIVSVRDARSKAVDPLFGNTVLPKVREGN
jgi:hypothetical protein